MFGLGFWELIAILLVAIVFINPKDLPKIARKVGYWYSQMREVGKWITNPVRELEEEMQKPLAEMKEEIQKPVQEFQEGVKDQLNELNTSSGNNYWKDSMPDLNRIMPTGNINYGAGKEEPERESKDKDIQETT